MQKVYERVGSDMGRGASDHANTNGVVVTNVQPTGHRASREKVGEPAIVNVGNIDIDEMDERGSAHKEIIPRWVHADRD